MWLSSMCKGKEGGLWFLPKSTPLFPLDPVQGVKFFTCRCPEEVGLGWSQERSCPNPHPHHALPTTWASPSGVIFLLPLFHSGDLGAEVVPCYSPYEYLLRARKIPESLNGAGPTASSTDPCNRILFCSCPLVPREGFPSRRTDYHCRDHWF